MNRCLGDQTLWSMSDGEASHEDRAHVASCTVCTARLRRLEEDLHHLTAVLREQPPVQIASPPPWSARAPWLSATAALAAVLMVVWVGLWQQSLVSTLPVESSQEPAWSSIDGVAAALFGSVDSEGIGTSEPLADLDDLQTALVGDWPCDEQVLFVGVACAEDTVALLFGGQ